jgi:hypothetical protein
VEKRTERLPSPYFRVDDVVPDTGIYRVFHSDHRLSHHALLLKDTWFPRCLQCGHNVQYEFIKRVPQVENDADFSSLRVFEISHLDQQTRRKKLA